MDIKELEYKAVLELRKLQQSDDLNMMSLSEYIVKLLIQYTLKKDIFENDLLDDRSYLKIEKNNIVYRLYLQIVDKDYVFVPEIEVPLELLGLLHKSIKISYSVLKKYINSEVCELNYTMNFKDHVYYLDENTPDRIGICLENYTEMCQTEQRQTEQRQTEQRQTEQRQTEQRQTEQC